MSALPRFYDAAAGPHLLLDAAHDCVIVVFDPAYTGLARGRFAGGATVYETADGRIVRAVLRAFSAGVSVSKLPVPGLVLDLLRDAASYGYFSVGWPGFSPLHPILGYVSDEPAPGLADAQ